MYNKMDFENTIQELFHSGAELGYTDEEIESLLDDIDPNLLLQAVRHNAETVYAYHVTTQCEAGINYCGEELFDQRAPLLYEDVDEAASELALVIRSKELWLLESMKIAVVSCVAVIVGDSELITEYRVFKGYDWLDSGIELDLESLAEGLGEMQFNHFGFDKPHYEL